MDTLGLETVLQKTLSHPQKEKEKEKSFGDFFCVVCSCLNQPILLLQMKTTFSTEEVTFVVLTNNQYFQMEIRNQKNAEARK